MASNGFFRCAFGFSTTKPLISPYTNSSLRFSSAVPNSSIGFPSATFGVPDIRAEMKHCPLRDRFPSEIHRNSSNRVSSVLCKRNEDEAEAEPALVYLKDGNLMVRNRVILRGMAPNLSLTSMGDGYLLGVEFEESSLGHVVSLGTLKNLDFTACCRTDWRMSRIEGNRGSELPCKTEFMLVDMNTHINGVKEELYLILLPFGGDSLRSSIQGREDDRLELCLRSNDQPIDKASCIFVAAGTDPFLLLHMGFCLIGNSLKDVKMHHWLASLATEGTAPPKFYVSDDEATQVIGNNSAIENEVALLKIWRSNKFGGVLGLFNCQGVAKSMGVFPMLEAPVTFFDLSFLDPNLKRGYAIYSQCEQRVALENHMRVGFHRSMEHDILLVSPILKIRAGYHVAVFGIVNHIYPCSFICDINFSELELKSLHLGVLTVKLRGGGRFAAYSMARPMSCTIEWKPVGYEYDYMNSLITFDIPPNGDGVQDVQMVYLFP